MTTSLEELVSIASDPLCDEPPDPTYLRLVLKSEVVGSLIEILDRKNGFYAFESALHVFPAGCGERCRDLESWNHADSWRRGYEEAAAGYLFFAEDVFGEQFALGDKGVSRFDPETASVESVAPDINQWAARILKDYNYETGYRLAHEWQDKHGPLAPGKRLLPKIPFVLGGEYKIENLYASDALTGMEYRAEMWQQIRELPDGTNVRLVIKRSN